MVEQKLPKTYVYVDNHKFKVYLDRPIEKCMTYTDNDFLIGAHLKIQELGKYQDKPEISKSLVNSIIEEIIQFHHQQSKVAPWLYKQEKIIGLTSYKIEFFVDSVV